MAIIIRGKTRCPLCGKVLEEGQAVVAFSSFVSNELDPLWIFNDDAFHRDCFYKHPLAEDAQDRYKEIRERQGPGNRFCIVCKREITDPDDYFALGHLVADNYHPLHRYNYTQVHRSHLQEWQELPSVYELLENLKESGAWRGEGLAKLMAELRTSLSGK